jgi:hypothetical protein
VRYARIEGALRATVWHELPGYLAADGATEALLWVLERAGFEAHDGDGQPPASYWRAKALMYLGVLGVRATRAAMAVLSVGYEAESMTYKRTLMEVHSRVRLVAADQSGEYARQWLQGQAGKPGKAVGSFSPDDFWAMLSHSSHADHRAVENFLAISQPDGTTQLLTRPERRAEVTNATLATFAGETRDIANVIAEEHELEIPRLAELDEAIAANFPWADKDHDSDEPEEESAH